ncbi:ParB/RepB/Spo0J family partition protein [Microbacterium indicum]|uniref:ParB/RepB/Spo0J family partition protein n=1 Tax=Microbacterium indicum TaxID=358100 RepID=UPI00042236C7|nr:ParB/RepB/Spo0J family partition protein [Microbacterium indicum]
MAKRTGLGRGIGALIPTATETKERPTDVFFASTAAQAVEEDLAEKKAPAKRAATSRGTAAKSSTSAKTAKPEADEAPKQPAAKRRTSRTSMPSVAESAPKKPQAQDEAPSPAAEPVEQELAEIPGLRLVQIDPNAIVPNPRQPRTLFDADDLAELVHSVREFGVLQPVVVRDKKDGTYELIMGERRTRASREAGLAEIPAIIRETADEDMLRDALLENIHRAQLNPLEEASAYQQLMNDFGITQDALATNIGRSRPQISNTIRLLRLPEPVQQRVAAGVLSAGHARAILSLDGDAEAMLKLADKIVNEELSVRAAESAARRVLETAEKPAAKPKAKQGARRAYLSDVADRLGDRLNTKVKVSLTSRKGQVTIDFASIQDLNRILEEIGETGYES